MNKRKIKAWARNNQDRIDYYILIMLIAVFVVIVFIAIGTAHDEDCKSCASYPEDLEEYYNPTILPQSRLPEVKSIEDIIEDEGVKAGLSEAEIETFKQIAWMESKNNPRAVSSTRDFGLFQINQVWDYDREKIFNPSYNAEFAFQVVYPKQGFEAWTTYNLIN